MVEQNRVILRPGKKAQLEFSDAECARRLSQPYITQIEPVYLRAGAYVFRIGIAALHFTRVNLAGLLCCWLLFCFQVAAQTEQALTMRGATPPPSTMPAGYEKKFETGVHFSILGYNDYGDRLIEPGIGGRLTYNLNDNLAFEGELNFYPRSREGDPTVSGRKTLALFGVKAGVRKGRFGYFGKARAGFIQFSRRLQFACIDGADDCTLSKRNFAFDVGGVAEFYLTRRTLLRFDLGDTVIRSSIVGGYNMTHNLQLSAGFGFRF